MLLRRYLEHFSTQNWTALVLDFFIVVAGIFLGLQVDGWNESRKDAVREREHLEQLYTDFSKNVEILDWMLEHHDGMAKDMMFAIGEVKKETLEAQDEERFKWAMDTLSNRYFIEQCEGDVSPGGWFASSAAVKHYTFSHRNLYRRPVC